MVFNSNVNEIVFSKDIMKKEIIDTKNELLCEENNILFLYYPYNYNFKFSLNKGYDKMYLSEVIYKKCYNPEKLDFVYKEQRYIKSTIFRDNEVKNIEYNLCNDSFDNLIEIIKEENVTVTVIAEDSENNMSKLKGLGFSDFVYWYELIRCNRDEVHTKGDFNKKIIEINNDIINKKDYVKPKLMIHSCCGPCSSYCLELLHSLFDVTILYYNPNIIPNEEYDYRLDEQKRLIKEMNLNINVIDIGYNHNEFLEAIKGLNDSGEGGIRCFACYKFRLEKTCLLAKKLGYDYFSTTLSISPYKNSEMINKLGIELENKHQMKFLYSNFKLNDGYKKSIVLSKKYNLYRQEYCGWEFSLKYPHKKTE